MKKLNTLRLILLLVVLLLIYGGLEYFGNTGRSKSLRSELVSLNVEAITEIRITGPGKQLTLSKTDENWAASNGTYSFVAEPDRVSSALATLETIQPSRIATRNPSKWQDFQVDSMGTRVQLLSGNEVELDIVLGRFGMQGQRQFHTYVRLFEENDVYVANDFMAFSFPQELSGYRNNTFLQVHPDSLNQIQFNYPDSSFRLEKSLAGNWLIDGTPTDSAKTVAYLNGLRNVISNSMFEGNPSTQLEADFTVELIPNNEVPIILEVQHEPQLLLQSSQNTTTLFSDEALIDKIFINQSAFLNEE